MSAHLPGAPRHTLRRPVGGGVEAGALDRLLLIGAGGFLGGHVWRQAAERGVEVVTASRSALPASPAHHRVDLSTCAVDELAGLLAEVGADVVVNCAGATGGGVEELAATNVTGVARLAGALLASGAPCRLVHVGSSAEYGASEWGTAVAESAPARPVGPYGATKLAGTELVEFAADAGLEAVVLRVFNPVGPGAPPTSLLGRLVGELHRSVPGGAPVHVGPLDAVRDFVDVRDVADAVLAAAAAPVLAHRVLNVGSGQGVAVRDLVKRLVSLAGGATTVEEDAPGSERSSQVMWQQADIARAARDLCWRPWRTLENSLCDCWEEYR